MAADKASEHDHLLGKGGTGSLPVWLDPQIFLKPNFDADACVADLRRYVPLNTLQAELNSYLGMLRSKLVEVINEDYSDYVNLSGKLSGVEGSVTRMRKPLLELKDKLKSVHEAVKAELNALNQGLRKRKEVATQRNLLELSQEVAHLAAKVEKLMSEASAWNPSTLSASETGTSGTAPQSTPVKPANSSRSAAEPDSPDAAEQTSSSAGSGGSDLATHARLLERVAGEVSRLSYLANRGKDLAFVKSQEPRINAYRADLSSRLSVTITAALQAQDHAAVLHLLHAYAELGEQRQAEAALRSVVVAPLVERAIAEHKAQGHAHRAGEAGLGALLSGMLASLRGALGPLLDALLAPGSTLRGFDVLGAVILEEVAGGIAAGLPGVFSPGVPTSFHANYLATQAWLIELEGLCASRTCLERFRASAAYAQLARRWNMSVYFSLLFQDIAGELEDALRQDKLLPAPQASQAHPQPQGATLAATATLARCLARAASRDVYLPPLADRFLLGAGSGLPPLADRFLRLALQLAQRYAAWVAAGSNARKEALAAATAGLPPPAAAASATDGSEAGTATGGAVPAAPGKPGEWMASLGAEELGAVIADADLVSTMIRDQYTRTFLELVGPVMTAAAVAAGSAGGDGPAAPAGGVGEELEASVRSALHEAAAQVSAAGQGMLEVVAEEVVERCSSVVKQLKGITATYRVTTKGPPTRHSHYVTGVLAPLRSLLDAPALRAMPQSGQQALVLRVVVGVATRYAALAEELLTSVRKTESSLKRLKKAKAGDDAAGESGMTDSDKIMLQLALDVAEFGAQVAKFGLDASALPEFRRLQEVVAPAAQAQQQ